MALSPVINYCICRFVCIAFKIVTMAKNILAMELKNGLIDILSLLEKKETKTIAWSLMLFDATALLLLN